MDHRSLYYPTLILRTQGVSFLASYIAFDLYIGWTCHVSIGLQREEEYEECSHLTQIDVTHSHPSQLPSSVLLGYHSPTRSSGSQSISGICNH